MDKARLKELAEIVIEDLLEAYDENGDMLDLVDYLIEKGFTKEELKEFKAFEGLLD